MPIGAINWNNSTKSLVLRGAGPRRGSSQYFSCRLDGSDLYIDDSPTVDESTRPWGKTGINEIKQTRLTGNAATKRQQAVDLFQLHVFDTVLPLVDFASDDPDKTIDPGRFPVEFWGNLLGKQAAPFDHYVARANILVDFDEVDFNNGILTATIKKAKVA